MTRTIHVAEIVDVDGPNLPPDALEQIDLARGGSVRAVATEFQIIAVHGDGEEQRATVRGPRSTVDGWHVDFPEGVVAGENRIHRRYDSGAEAIAGAKTVMAAVVDARARRYEADAVITTALDRAGGRP